MKHGRFGKPRTRRIILNCAQKRFEWWTDNMDKLIDSAVTKELLSVVAGRKTQGFHKADHKVKRKYNTRASAAASAASATQDGSDSDSEMGSSISSVASSVLDYENISCSLIFSNRNLDLEATNIATRDQFVEDVKLLIDNPTIFFTSK